jgi:hypothetical protein
MGSRNVTPPDQVTLNYKARIRSLYRAATIIACGVDALRRVWDAFARMSRT